MKTKKEKQTSFAEEMKKLKKEGLLKEEKHFFTSILKKALKPQRTSR